MTTKTKSPAEITHEAYIDWQKDFDACRRFTNVGDFIIYRLDEAGWRVSKPVQ